MIIEIIKKFIADFLIKLVVLGYLFVMLIVAYIFAINDINILLSFLASTLLYSPILIFSLMKYGKFYKKVNIKNEAQHIRNVEIEYDKIVKSENS